MSARSCQVAWLTADPCSAEGPVFDVVYSSHPSGNVLDRVQACERHGAVQVDRAFASALMARVALERVGVEEPVQVYSGQHDRPVSVDEEPQVLPGDFVVVDLSDEVALHAALVQWCRAPGPQRNAFREALRTAGTEVGQLPDEEVVDSRDPGTGAPLGRRREVWAGTWTEAH